MSLYEARFGVAVPRPQVSSLYEALTWGFIHLRLFEPLAPSALAMRALSRTCHGMSLHWARNPHGKLWERAVARPVAVTMGNN